MNDTLTLSGVPAPARDTRTVFGMLVTFQALASGSGGEVTEAMAGGISQALFPPEVGLCISLPGGLYRSR